MPAGAGAARPLDLGIVDGQAFTDPNDSARTLAFDRTASARAGTALIGVRWASVAPGNPGPLFNARNPADPAYQWDAIDDAVRSADSHGLRVILLVTGAPRFAEGPNRPSTDRALPGTWRPDPADVADFGHAIATRYSGLFATLPRVRLYQLWAEPNLAVNLAPQRQGGHLISGNVYRGMLNAFYGAVKGVSGANTVITGGTAPYGDLFPASGAVFPRTQPVEFWRQVFCLKGRRLRPLKCPAPPRFDVISHHPINVGPPTRHAINAEDISTPDLGKLKRILRRAQRAGHVRPRGKKPLWATEIWWNSRPPVGSGVPLALHARWLEQSFYVLWKQKVRAVIWFEIRDYAPEPGIPIPRSGLFLRDGTVKPAFFAFRFPFVGDRLSRRRVRVWGTAPQPGSVQIQRRKGGRWKRVRTLRAGSNRVFVGVIRLRGRAKLRAVSAGEHSLTWKQR